MLYVNSMPQFDIVFSKRKSTKDSYLDVSNLNFLSQLNKIKIKLNVFKRLEKLKETDN
jgi:hypothetical protein